MSATQQITEQFSEVTTSQLNTSLYLSPDRLTPNEANEKARPGETPERRAKRVGEMAASIAANGQKYPVLAVEIQDIDDNQKPFVRYEYVDGGCRVEAIAQLNEQADSALNVWCSLVDPNTDLFRTSVIGNLHRTQNSMLEIAQIVAETGDRNNWKGKGRGKKIAEYLGLGTNRVSEYEKILRAPAAIREKIQSGEINTVDAALRLLAQPEDMQPHLAQRAIEIAREEAERKARERQEADAAATSYTPVTNAPDARNSGEGEAATAGIEKAPTPTDGELFTIPDLEPSEVLGALNAVNEPVIKAEPAPQEVKVSARHVDEAVRESGQKVARGKAQIIDFFGSVSLAAYPQPAVDFSAYLVDKWIPGDGNDKKLRSLFDALVSTKGRIKDAKPIKPIKAASAKAASGKAPAAAKKAVAKKKAKAKR